MNLLNYSEYASYGHSYRKILYSWNIIWSKILDQYTEHFLKMCFSYCLLLLENISENYVCNINRVRFHNCLSPVNTNKSNVWNFNSIKSSFNDNDKLLLYINNIRLLVWENSFCSIFFLFVPLFISLVHLRSKIVSKIFKNFHCVYIVCVASISTIFSFATGTCSDAMAKVWQWWRWQQRRREEKLLASPNQKQFKGLIIIESDLIWRRWQEINVKYCRQSGVFPIFFILVAYLIWTNMFETLVWKQNQMYFKLNCSYSSLYLSLFNLSFFSIFLSSGFLVLFSFHFFYCLGCRTIWKYGR